MEVRTVERLLSSLATKPWEGTVFRLMLGEAPPDRENTRGARWNPPDMPAVYTSLEAETAIAEVEFNLSRQPRPVRPNLKKTLYELHVRINALLDLRSALKRLEELGINQTQLFADDMRASQEIGRITTWFGYDGLLTPSARAAGTNLVIFPSRVDIASFEFSVIRSKLLNLE